MTGFRLPARALLGTALVALAGAACVQQFSTDIPVNFQDKVKQRYAGRSAWTRSTLEDEKKDLRIEQDQEVLVVGIGMHRSGSVTLQSKKKTLRIVYPFRLDRPLNLEFYETALLDHLWFESPEERFTKLKEQYGTRLAEAIRDHKILNDMPQYLAYLSWGKPTDIIQVEGSTVERWRYNTPNLSGAQIDFDAGKVVRFDGENVSDTEAAQKRKLARRGRR